MLFSGKSLLVIFLPALVLFSSCGRNKSDKKIAAKEMDEHVEEAISAMLGKANPAKLNLDDSTRLSALNAVKYCYAAHDEKPIWSHNKRWLPMADALVHYLDTCAWDGLFADDYQAALVKGLKLQLDRDSLAQTKPEKWARADILLTNACLHLFQDLKQGRLQPDSLAWLNKKLQFENFFKPMLDSLKAGKTFAALAASLQPATKYYVAIRQGIKPFVAKMDRRPYTYLQYPFRDSLAFVNALVKRLAEGGIVSDGPKPDSAQLGSLISRFQKEHALKVTGKLSVELVREMNNTDLEKFKRIAITMDKYKLMPGNLPDKYIWVNLPAYTLQLWEKDSLVVESKVIIGKPATPTPDISSQISDLVIYPTWTVPTSIIQKEILPGLKRNSDYLRKKGLDLFDYKGNPVDPHAVNWSKYNKGIPYMVRQGSGDNNALGVIKFNFKNPYAVYLHDTNQRYLFANKNRSMSHGCVRVQEWDKLATYIIRNDSTLSHLPEAQRLSADSIKSWIAEKQRHTVPVKERIPLYITYFGCSGEQGNIRFYDDVYSRDKALREKYFASK